MSINSFNSLLDKAISVANVAGKKTEEMVEASKLKIQEVSVNADLANCYEKIGSLVYSSKKFGADNEQEIAQLIAQADELLEQLAQLQAKREEIRKVRKCPNCGASCATDAHFCSRCGMVLHEETSELKDTDFDIYYYAHYANWLDTAAQEYKLASTVTGAVSDQTIVDYIQQDDVITTTYANGTVTTVNLKTGQITCNGTSYALSDYVEEGGLLS